VLAERKPVYGRDKRKDDTETMDIKRKETRGWFRDWKKVRRSSKRA